jgi:hypothetical protein
MRIKNSAISKIFALPRKQGKKFDVFNLLGCELSFEAFGILASSE